MITARFRATMIRFAAKVMRRAGVSPLAADQAAEDVLQDAIVYRLRRGDAALEDSGRLVGAVRFYARSAAREDVIKVGARESKRTRPITSTFPNQIFGCRLADAFLPAGELENMRRAA